MSERDEALRELQARFARLTERRAVRVASTEYDEAMSATTRRVGRSTRGSRPAGPALLDALRGAHAEHAHRVTDALMTAVEEAHRDSLRGLARFVSRFEGRATSLEDPAVFSRVLDRRRSASRRMITSAMESHSHELVSASRVALIRAGTVTTRAALPLIEEASDSTRWMVERIARTEASRAYNAAMHDGIDALAAEFPGLMVRWVEHVSDTTWRPTDSKTAPDSIALHGQVKRPNGLFVMPGDGPERMVGQTYDFPPNRPNDRAVIMPWRAQWRIPAYTMESGERRWLVRRVA